MTPESFAAHVDESIAMALRHQSYIDEAILGLTGFSTGVMRRLVSNLCHLPKANPAYLEIGLYAGATFCAALNNNRHLTAIGIEDFSQPFGDPDIQAKLLRAMEEYRGDAKDVDVINDHCFDTTAGALKMRGHPPIDVYFYDGCHDRFDQARALPHFIDALAPLFLFMVDDANWESVRDGTADGFAALKDRVKIEREWHLVGEKRQDDSVWWNGVALFLCSKL